MLLTLLLETKRTIAIETSDLKASYIALLGTLIAATIAAIASFVASKRAYRAAKEASERSAQTAIYVAELSALTSKLSTETTKEVAALSNLTARELKAKDHKHDFYKKVLDRRFTAWEHIELFMAKIAHGFNDNNDNERKVVAYCANGNKLDEVIDEMSILAISQVFWIGKEFTSAFNDLLNENYKIRGESVIPTQEKGVAPIDEDLLMKAGKKHYKKCASLINNLLRIMRDQAPNLFDIENFWLNIDHIGLQEE